jgi:hypothetical protein
MIVKTHHLPYPNNTKLFNSFLSRSASDPEVSFTQAAAADSTIWWLIYFHLANLAPYHYHRLSNGCWYITT